MRLWSFTRWARRHGSNYCGEKLVPQFGARLHCLSNFALDASQVSRYNRNENVGVLVIFKYLLWDFTKYRGPGSHWKRSRCLHNVNKLCNLSWISLDKSNYQTVSILILPSSLCLLHLCRSQNENFSCGVLSVENVFFRKRKVSKQIKNT